MPSFRIEIPEKINKDIEEQSQTEGTSRQKIIQSILEEYYAGPRQSDLSELQHKTELLEATMRENEVLREYVEMLRGISIMMATKQLLPAGSDTKKRLSWWSRFKLRVFGH